MMKNTALLIILTVLSIVSPASYAQLPPHLIQQVMPVESRSSGERLGAEKQAAVDALITMTGEANLGENPKVVAAIRTVSPVDKRYYNTNDDGTLSLHVDLDKNKLKKILRDTGIPYWPQERPNYLVWLVTSSASQPEKIIATADDPIAQSLIKGLKLRGVKANFPKMDLTDRFAVDADVIWSRDWPTILEGSKRYQSGCILLGKGYQSSTGRWRSEWVTRCNGDDEVQSLFGLTTDEFVAKGVEEAVSSAREGQTIDLNKARRTVVMTVSSVQGFTHYQKVRKLLESTAGIVDVRISSITSNQLTFTLSTLFDDARLRSVLQQSGQLMAKDDGLHFVSTQW